MKVRNNIKKRVGIRDVVKDGVELICRLGILGGNI